MTSIEKSVFGSFFKICEYDSPMFNVLNRSKPYLTVNGKDKEVTVIKEEKDHLKFLSEKLGYEALSYTDWCNERNIKCDDKTVRSAYQRYISDKEYEVKNMIV